MKNYNIKIEKKEVKQLRKELSELTLERDKLRKDILPFLPKRLDIYKFVEEYRDIFPVDKICKYLEISRNAYYQWRNKDHGKVSRTDLLKERIKEIYEENNQRFGSPRIAKVLQNEGYSVSRSYVGRLMKGMGLKMKSLSTMR